MRIITARALVATLALTLAFGCARGNGNGTSLDPDEFIATARLPEGLRLELAAREPNVVDPVAVAFDANGRMYVVEMGDYPMRPEGSGPLGRVKLLDDTDGDGYYETVSLFAAGLQHPTSVLPWRGGVLVTAPPHILFLEDTDGDDVADRREPLFTGFPVGNTQHNINGLTWGLDNWVYAANGGNHGSGHPAGAPDDAVSIRGMDFRFRPDTGELEVSYETTGGHGIAFDAWGRMFGTHNLNHVQHMVFPTWYLTRNPWLAVPTTRDMVSDHESSAMLYQVSPPQTRVNHPEQAGRFSGGSGIGYYGGGALPAPFEGSLFVNDVVVNLVHQDVLTPHGPSFTASRHETEAELLGGRDTWFRPVTLATGPHGGLYVVDMHRAVIEHPEWIPDAVEETLDVRAGDDKGRIYRIVPAEGLPASGTPRLGDATLATLVDILASPNKWRRDTAQRLLVERQDQAAGPLLAVRLGADAPARARLHALWTLRGLGALRVDQIVTALGDPSGGVRENALRLAEAEIDANDTLLTEVAALADDPDPRVRMQVALTVGDSGDDRARDALLTILQRDADSRWARYAVLTGLTADTAGVLSGLLGDDGDSDVAAAFTSDISDGRLDVVRHLAAVTGTARGPADLGTVLRLAGRPGLDARWRVALLDGLADGLERGEPSPEGTGIERDLNTLLAPSSPTPVVRAALRVATHLEVEATAARDRALAAARQRAADPDLAVDRRVEEIALLALDTYAQVGATLLALMEPRSPLEVQVAATNALAGLADPTAEGRGQAVLEGWRRYGPEVRTIALGMLLRTRAFHEPLIVALETGALRVGELNLDLEQRRRLLRRSTADLQRRAAALFGDHEFSNRRETVDRLLPDVLGRRGNARRGEAHFQTLCAPCHFFQGQGHAVGPDLGMAFTKGSEDLLTSIVDPNAAIAPEYTNYQVDTVTGELTNGIITGETPSSVTLARADGDTETILRSEISEMRTDGLSLMPDGLEQGLDAGDLADLLAYLQQHNH